VKRWVWFVLVAMVLAAAYLAAGRAGSTPARAQLVVPALAAGAGDAAGFARATGPLPLTFPADHGPHPDYQTEWWYITGNLTTSNGRHFGYQLTFFRRALVPPALRVARPSAWATDQAYMAHFALTDVAGKRHQAIERLSRGAAGLAGAQAVPFRVWLEDWSVAEIGANVYRLNATQGDLALDLQLTDLKGPVLQGERGYSQKGPDPGNASYYTSLTRLPSAGTVRVGGATYAVSGLSWMDHEFSTSALSPDQVGWDWFALQLEDGSELMLFQLRRADGSVDPFASGTFVAPNGETRRLTRGDFEMRVNGTWRSPRSRANYPAAWTIKLPSLELTLDIQPYLADQELDVSYRYWEGAVKISGERAGRAVTGDGYIELTGYAGSMGGQF